MKRIFSILLVFTVALSLTSCKRDREYDEYEVKTAAESLIKKSKTLNDIYWGAGIGYYEDDSYSEGNYYPADPLSLKNYGIYSTDDLKEKTRAVFTENYCKSIFLSSIADGENENSLDAPKRYYQQFDYFMVHSEAIPLLTDEISYHYDTLEVLGADGDAVTVQIAVTVKRDGQTQDKTLSINLIEEADGWKIDTPTYTTYKQE